MALPHCCELGWRGGWCGCLSSVISTPISLPELGAVTGSSLLLTQPKSELGIWPGRGVLTCAPPHNQSHTLRATHGHSHTLWVFGKLLVHSKAPQQPRLPQPRSRELGSGTEEEKGAEGAGSW